MTSILSLRGPSYGAEHSDAAPATPVLAVPEAQAGHRQEAACTVRRHWVLRREAVYFCLGRDCLGPGPPQAQGLCHSSLSGANASWIAQTGSAAPPFAPAGFPLPVPAEYPVPAHRGVPCACALGRHRVLRRPPVAGGRDLDLRPRAQESSGRANGQPTSDVIQIEKCRGLPPAIDFHPSPCYNEGAPKHGAAGPSRPARERAALTRAVRGPGSTHRNTTPAHRPAVAGFAF